MQDHTNEQYFCLEWSWRITHVGGEHVTKEHVNVPKTIDGKHHSCINDGYLHEAVNVIQAKAQTVHEALLTAKENQKLSELATGKP